MTFQTSRFNLLPNWNRHALLTCAEMRKAEDINCAKGPHDFYGLMQNAGKAVAEEIMKRWQPCRILVMCGPGNNGGDGYVAAETLRLAGWQVMVGAMATNNQPPAAAQAKAAWHGKTCVLDAALFNEADLVIDALFGTGLQRPLEGEIAAIIEKLNASGLPVIAADFPSGIDGDTGRVLGIAVKARITVTFFRKKRGHLLLPGTKLCGEVIVASTDMDEFVLEDINPTIAENHPDLWLDLLPLPKAEEHKYNRGHALVYGGHVMTGAARLAARAAQRMGAGLVTLAAPENAIPIYATALESVIVQRAENDNEWRALLNDAKKTAVLIGPGAGMMEKNKTIVLESLKSAKPCVLDADALTVFADEPDKLFKSLHPSCILTPHEGEFARLFKKSLSPDADKITRALKAAEIAGCIVLLKGADTVVANSDGYAIVNHNAPPWLATAGSGDVLSGMILGLIAQGMPPFASASAAVFMHGKAASNFGPGLIAEDLIGGIPAVLRSLLHFKG